MNLLGIGNLLFPGRTLARRTLPPKGQEFSNFFRKPESRTFEDKVKFAKIIEENHHVATVQLGTKVEVKNLSTKKIEEYTIVGSTEANPLEKRISNESPVGSAFLEKRVGDVVKIQVPAGFVQYEILKLE